MKILQRSFTSLFSIILLSSSTFLNAETVERTAAQRKKSESPAPRRELEIALRFAPVFYQKLGKSKRSDYITNFNFDGDWRGDNNWAHATNLRFPMKAYVYYAAVETGTHYFIHYAIFHARDYKGGEWRGTLLSQLMREGARRAGKYDPTGIAEESALAHENDLEGCLVVVAKDGDDSQRGRTVFVETLRHNTIARYVAGQQVDNDSKTFRTLNERPLLYVEPKGHGIEAFTGEGQTAGRDIITYVSAARAGNPEKTTSQSIGYELVPIETTLWKKAQGGINPTYAEAHDFGEVSIKLQSGVLKTKVPRIGIAFAGEVGGLNMARAPWGWFDRSNREGTMGVWFFDPASVIKRDFHLDDGFSTTYLWLPFWAGAR